MSNRISFTEFKKTLLQTNDRAITLYQCGIETWKARTVYVNSNVTVPTYVHERGQKKPSALIISPDYLSNPEMIAAMFSRVNLAGSYLTVVDEGKATEIWYDKVFPKVALKNVA